MDINVINRFKVILQVQSCGIANNADRFAEYCMEIAKLFVQLYPWFCMPTTVHKVLMHGAQIIESAVLPIGLFSEDAQKSRNKDSKKLRQNYSRKSSRQQTMEDVFHGLPVSSDPYISSLRKLPPKSINLYLLNQKNFLWFMKDNYI